MGYRGRDRMIVRVIVVLANFQLYQVEKKLIVNEMMMMLALY